MVALAIFRRQLTAGHGKPLGQIHRLGIVKLKAGKNLIGQPREGKKSACN
jgi:hypothetical protein